MGSEEKAHSSLLIAHCSLLIAHQLAKLDSTEVLSRRLLQVLREYWKRERPPEWLFPGQGKCGHVSPDNVRQVFRRAREAAGLGKWCMPHTLGPAGEIEAKHLERSYSIPQPVTI